jgi:hypothetical protein
MSEDKLFEEKLLNLVFRTAFDPIARRFVRILRVTRVNDRIRVIATRVGEFSPHEYAVTQLTQYAA